MRRINNIYWQEYERMLDEEGITPEDEVNDILEEIKDKTGEFYEELRNNLISYMIAVKSGEPVLLKKKKATAREYLSSFICRPIDKMRENEHKRPIIFEPLNDGTKREYWHYNLTEEEREENALLHWIYIELETIWSRTEEK